MSPRILVAGIGNMFLADDGFGVVVAQRLVTHPLPDGVQVVDYGIRGLDLAYALLDQWRAVILVDTVARGQSPGTLYLIEPAMDQTGLIAPDAHGMDPVKVLALARSLGAAPVPTYLVGCEPELLINPDEGDVVVQLSAPVQGAIDEAMRMVESLVERIIARAPVVAGSVELGS
ncbi:MAG TPA: hydrogenase maturation protease [Chloroflexota bacterium]|nr:hydrogenase maturation protease [Chloroflexota bacterium]